MDFSSIFALPNPFLFLVHINIRILPVLFRMTLQLVTCLDLPVQVWLVSCPNKIELEIGYVSIFKDVLLNLCLKA